MRARISPASRSENFDRQRDSFSAPDTQAGDAASSSVALQSVNQRGDNPCTAGTDRMAKCNRASMDVDTVTFQSELSHHRHRDSRKRFVDLKEIDIAGF
jgi:hypothetical protein